MKATLDFLAFFHRHPAAGEPGLLDFLWPGTQVVKPDGRFLQGNRMKILSTNQRCSESLSELFDSQEKVHDNVQNFGIHQTSYWFFLNILRNWKTRARTRSRLIRLRKSCFWCFALCFRGPTIGGGCPLRREEARFSTPFPAL